MVYNELQRFYILIEYTQGNFSGTLWSGGVGSGEEYVIVPD